MFRTFSFVYFFLLFFSSQLSAQDVNIFLIGDAGDPDLPVDKNLEFLKQKTSGATEQDVLIFLGNNVFPMGLPNPEHPDREQMENKLKAQLDVLKLFNGKSFIIPGNMDWAQTRKNGWDYVKNQEEYVTDYLTDEGIFQPRGGCPGPIEIPLSDEAVLIIIDTQYFLHPWDKPRTEDGCEVDGSLAALELLEDAIQRNRDKHIIVAGHHPIYSTGPYGKKAGLNKQSLKNPRYKSIRNALSEVFDKVEHLVYVSGHDNSMQYIRKGDDHFIVSGSGSGTSNVTSGEGSVFTNNSKGFAQLVYKEGGATSLNFWNSDDQQSLFSEEIFNREIITEAEAREIRPDFSDSTVILSGNDNLAFKGKAQKFWLGNSYRNEWSVPFEVKVFDIEKEHGGLEILKKGGGGQTKSLRLEAENGRQYVLRSIKKWPVKATVCFKENLCSITC